MKTPQRRGRQFAVLIRALVFLVCLAAGFGRAADYGRMVGTVTDTQGNPLMGASVLIVGPVLAVRSVDATVLRVITDTHGKFAAEHLVPGWYSLRVTSATRLPALRSGVRVEAGGTSQLKFVLGDILAPVRINLPADSVSRLGDDWKWVLRTSATTRPVLRYQQVARNGSSPKTPKVRLPADQRLVGMMPGAVRRGGLAGDPGLGSVLAYLRPLSEDADLLVAGSMTANSVQATSVAAAFRKNILRGDAQELSLVVHHLSFSEGGALEVGEARGDLYRGQGVSIHYGRTRRLSGSLSLTSGFDVDYLNAARDAVAVRPRMKLEYQLNPSTSVAVRYGMARGEASGTLLERVGTLNAFPRVTMRKYRPKLEEATHVEASLTRRLGRKARAEVAVYRDDFRDAAVWGFGDAGALEWLAGDYMPNPAANGVVLNAGNYRSSGVRATYACGLGEHVEMAFMYAVGDALTGAREGLSGEGARTDLQRLVRPARSQFVGGKLSAWIPLTRTYVVTSYGWLPPGRVSGVDPYGLANLQVQPFLGVQIRQPLPTLTFIPARIEALADFRNLVGQGSVSVSGAEATPLLLTAAYRSFRGGFSVQF